MQFVYPGFLFALTAIFIPVIIHLFHFRRFRKVYFPNVSFLQHLSDESKKQSRLKHLLVLASRILVITFLVLAFARPYVPAENPVINQQSHVAGVYLDNSFSMESLGGSGNLLDQARGHARQIAALYSPADRFLLLTNDFEARHQRLLSREEFLLMLDEVKVTPVVRSVAEAMQRLQELMPETSRQSHSSYIISDFQKSTASLDEILPDTTALVYFIPLEAQQGGNVFIDSIWFESPVRIVGQPVTLRVRVHNDNDQALENQPLRLNIDGNQRAVASFDAPPEQQVEVPLTWTIQGAEDRQGRVEILDYPVTFDDQVFFSYQSASDIPVLAINQEQPAPFLKALFGNDPTFLLANMSASAIDYSAFGQNNLIILNNLNNIAPGLASQLLQYVEQGGSLVVFPGTNIDQDSYRELLSSLNVEYGSGPGSATRVTSLNELHEVFAGVFEAIPENIDLPQVQQYYPIRQDRTSQGQFLLQLQNGQHFFSSWLWGKGRVFLSAVPLDDRFSNFQRHPIFVPLLANIALQSQSLQPLYYTLGQNQPVVMAGPSANREELYYLQGPQGEVIPEQQPGSSTTRLFFHDQVKQAGNYALTRNGQPLRGLSFNDNRRESLLESLTAAQLREILLDQGLAYIQIIQAAQADLKLALQQAHVGNPLWRYFLILALLFLLVEGVLLRFWR